MRKIYILIFLTVCGFFCINSLFYIRIYNQQLDFQTELLKQQISICGNTIEQNGMDFESEVNYILFSSNISELFSDSEGKERNMKNLELFYTKYEDLISNINIYNNDRQVYRLLKDKGNNNYVRDFYESQRQEILEKHDLLREQNGEHQLIIPVFRENKVVANIVISIDYQKYINTVFDQYRLQNTLWQWFVIMDSTQSSFHPGNIVIPDRDIKKVASDIEEGNTGSIVHSIEIDGEREKVISVYYPVNLVRKDFGIVFSIKSDLFLRSIFQKTIIIIVLSLLMLALVYFILFWFQKAGLKESGKQNITGNLLRQMIDDLPSGLIILDNNKTINTINQKAIKLLNIISDDDQEIKRSVGLLLDSPSVIEPLYEKYFGPGETVKYRNNNHKKDLFRQDIKIRFQNQDLMLLVLTDISQYEKTRKRKKVSYQARNSLLEQMKQEIIIQLLQIKKQAAIMEKKSKEPAKDGYLKMIIKSTGLLFDLINSTFNFSQADPEKAVLEEIPFRLHNEMNRIIEELKPAAIAKKIEIITKIGEDVPDRVIGDPFRLRQIISGLIETSLEMNEEGKMLVSAETIVHLYDKLKIRFQVEDTGTGVLPGVQRKQKVINTDNGDKSSKKSPDESLSKSDHIKQCIELLNSELYTESPSSLSTNPDNPGIKFSFTLDLIPDESHKKNLDYSRLTKISDIHCLILSKEESAEEDFMTPFHEIGCTVKQRIYSPDNLDDIISHLPENKNEYQILLIHDRLLENDLELLTCLNEHHIDNDFLIIVLNTDDQINNFLKFKRFGADYYLVHPYDLVEMGEIISHHFPGIKPENLKIPRGSQLKKDLRILLAEDNILSRKDARAIFKKLGYEIDCASNGTEVMEKLSETKYDIIFLDLLIPFKDGLEIISEIRKLGYTMPVIALNASDTAETVKTIKQVGINSYLVKPLKKSDIRRILLQNFPVKS